MTIRTGSVLAKASRTDNEYQRFSVREITDLGIEYYHKQLGDWYTLPSEWTESIVWE